MAEQQSSSVVVCDQPKSSPGKESTDAGDENRNNRGGRKQENKDDKADKEKRPPPIQNLIFRRREPWHTAICACCDDFNGCMYCTFLYPCFIFTLARDMDECVVGPHLCCCMFCVPLRSTMRALYDIQGSILCDACCVICCHCCIMAQMDREIKHRVLAKQVLHD